MTSTAIPLGDAPSLRRHLRRTALVRGALGVAIVVCATLALVFANTSSNRNAPVLPAQSDGIVVLDLSASAGASEYGEIGRYLRDLIRSHGRFGLVVFSGTAYEMLPPNAPSSALATVSQYFRPPYPTNPWTAGFSLGTSISKGLDLARSLLLADRVKRRDVWLISDLSDSANNRPALARSLRTYVTSRIRLHVLPVHALAADIAPYQRLFGPPNPTIHVPPLPTTRPRSGSYAFPLALAVLACLLAVALAGNELLSAPLRWGHPPAEAIS